MLLPKTCPPPPPQLMAGSSGDRPHGAADRQQEGKAGSAWPGPVLRMSPNTLPAQMGPLPTHTHLAWERAARGVAVSGLSLSCTRSAGCPGEHRPARPATVLPPQDPAPRGGPPSLTGPSSRTGRYGTLGTARCIQVEGRGGGRTQPGGPSRQPPQVADRETPHRQSSVTPEQDRLRWQGRPVSHTHTEEALQPLSPLHLRPTKPHPAFPLQC